MSGIYRARHPERTVLYRVIFHHFDSFLAEYETRFEREYGFFCPIVKEVVERYLDCGKLDKISFTRSSRFYDLDPVHAEPLAKGHLR